MTIDARKRIELEQKVSSLDAEFQKWLAESEAGEPLEKHHTQLQRITAQLGAFQGLLRDRLQAASNALLDGAQDVERAVLELHRIWEFFRAKLALRKVPWLSEYLEAADELAWACYLPPCERAVRSGAVPIERVREPPLVFFSGGMSPFVLPRTASFQPEGSGYGVLPIDEFAGLLRALPVPVVGVPWFQMAHLPEALVIAHEVGHDIDDDLGLATTMRPRLEDVLERAGAKPDRRAAWAAWRSEAFADVFATQAVGPAFVGALVDFLAADPATIAAERQSSPGWGAYPTVHLRVLLCIEVVRQLELRELAESLKTEWTKAHPAQAMACFEVDVEPVVRAFRMEPMPQLGEACLADVLPFDHLAHERAVNDARNVLDRVSPKAGDARVLVAAARLAFAENPERYVASGAQKRLLDALLRVRASGVRGGARDGGADAAARLAVHDAAAGRRLGERLLAPRAP